MEIVDPERRKKTERFLTKCHRQYNRRRDTIVRAFDSGDEDAALHRVATRFFNDQLSKVSALYRAGLRLPTPEGYLEAASSLRLNTPFAGPVYWQYIPKRSGGLRTICILPTDLKAAHIMIKDALLAQMCVPEHVYGLGGPKDRNALVRMIGAALNNGLAAFGVYDIKNCFPSVRTTALHELPLPGEVIDHALDISNLNAVKATVAAPKEVSPNDPHGYSSTHSPNEDHLYTMPGGPIGLLQGSPASNAIFGYLIQHLPQPEPGSGLIGSYCDDLFLGARSEAELEALEDRVGGFFGYRRLGPLDMVKRIGTCDAFEFLGYSFERGSDSPWSDFPASQWRIGLSNANHVRLERRLRDALRHDLWAGGSTPSRAIAVLEENLRNFLEITSPWIQELYMHMIDEDFSCGLENFGVPGEPESLEAWFASGPWRR